jgi:protein TonB
MKTWHLPLQKPTPDRRIGLRLFGFVLASVLLHGLLLLSQRPTMELGSDDNTTMRITLGEIKKITATAAQRPAVRRQSSETVEPRIERRERRPAPTSVKEAITTSTASSSEPAAKTLPPQQSAATDRSTPVEATATATTQEQHLTLSHLLKQALAKQFYYPLLARKRGWQGEVRLAFTLDTSGTITGARIAQGSGYRALDRAAMNSLARVAGIGIPLSEQLSFELPVIYSLNGG